VDAARAYTSVMAGLPRLPVFSKFDDLRTPSGTILSHAFYLVWVPTTDPILFSQELELVSCTVLVYAQERRIENSLEAELVPHKTAGHSIGKVLHELYEESGLDDADKKQVTILSYGLAGRRYNKAASGSSIRTSTRLRDTPTADFAQNWHQTCTLSLIRSSVSCQEDIDRCLA
jgi:hypothetical protein